MSVVATIAAVCIASLDGGVWTQLPPVDVVDLDTETEPQHSASSPWVRDPSATVTTVDAQKSRQQAQDAAALLTTVPGAVVQDSGGYGQRKTLSLRGAAPQSVLVLFDGIPLAGPGAAVDLSRIPTAALERMEVLRGGGSARYGPGAMGGVVNLVPKSPRGTAALFLEATQGSFITSQLSLGGTAPVGGGEALVLLHGLRSDGTFDFRFDPTPAFAGQDWLALRRNNNHSLQGGGLARFRKQWGHTQVDWLAEGATEHRGLAGPIQNPSPSASQSTSRGLLSARTRTTDIAGGVLSALVFGRLENTVLHGTFFGGGTYQQRELSSGAEATFARAMGRHGLTALVGGGSDSLWAQNALGASWGRFAALVGDEVWWWDGALTAHGSVRVDIAGPFAVWSPKLGLVAELPLGFSLRANAGQANRAPSFSELYVIQGTLLPNADLRPERALTFDASAAWTSPFFQATATGFLSLYEDLISYEYYPPNLARPFNFQAARVAGVEVEASARWRTWLQGSLAYTFMHSQNMKDDPRYYLKSLPFRPAHRLHARIVGGVEYLKARAELIFQSEQFMNRTETLSLPARAFLNLGVTAQLWHKPAVSLSVELKNALDVQAQDMDGYPLPPRALFVTFSVGWQPSASPRSAGDVSQDAVTGKTL